MYDSHKMKLFFILTVFPLILASKSTLLHVDLDAPYATGTFLTVFFKLNKETCKGDACRTYIDLRADSSKDYDSTKDVPAIVQVSDDEHYGVRIGSQTEISRTFGTAISIPLGKKPSAFDMWTVDILKVSSNELRIFFQSTGGVLAQTIRSMDEIKSIHLWTDEWTPGSNDPTPQIKVQFPNELILNESQEQILARFDKTTNDKEANRVVAGISSFPVGSHLHLITFAKKSVGAETDSGKSAVGLRGKQSTGAFPVSIEYRWGGEQSSSSELNSNSDDKKICFDDKVTNELAHMDIWRLNSTAVLMELHYMRAPGASTAHCLSCIYSHPSYETELNQPLDMLEVHGAIVLHAHFMPADSTQYPIKPDRC